MRTTADRSATLAQSLATIRPLVTASPGWPDLARRHGFAGSRELALAQTLARRPGLTLGGYVDHLHTYASSVIDGLLERLVLRQLFELERGRYWPTAAYTVRSADLTTARRAALVGWLGMPQPQLHQLAALTEQLCAAIPLAHLGSHSLYAYGQRPAPEAERCIAERILIAATALGNYRLDAQALAWARADLPPPSGLLVQLLAHGPEPQLVAAVCERARLQLGPATVPALQTLVDAEWLVVSGPTLRLTATGWARWAPIEEALADQLDPVYAALAPADQACCINSIGQLQRQVAAYQRARCGMVTPQRSGLAELAGPSRSTI